MFLTSIRPTLFYALTLDQQQTKNKLTANSHKHFSLFSFLFSFFNDARSANDSKANDAKSANDNEAVLRAQRIRPFHTDADKKFHADDRRF